MKWYEDLVTNHFLFLWRMTTEDDDRNYLSFLVLIINSSWFIRTEPSEPGGHGTPPALWGQIMPTTLLFALPPIKKFRPTLGLQYYDASVTYSIIMFNFGNTKSITHNTMERSPFWSHIIVFMNRINVIFWEGHKVWRNLPPELQLAIIAKNNNHYL